MPVQQFTTKPTRVKLLQWTGHNADEMKDFIGPFFLGHDTHPRYNATIRVSIRDTKPVYPGEWVGMGLYYPYIVSPVDMRDNYQNGNQQLPNAYKPPRRFELIREKDITGVSGEGVVVCGVQWYDGSVALMWNTAVSSTTRFPDVDSMMHIHGHDGATKLAWLDPE